jgi:hypothetical protein
MGGVVLGVYLRKWRGSNLCVTKLNEIALENGITPPNCAAAAGNDGGKGRGKVFGQ